MNSPTATATASPILTLQINTTGAWRNLKDFRFVEITHVMLHSEMLFMGDTHCTLRIKAKDYTAPLMTCTPGKGWVNWADRTYHVCA